MKQGNGSDILGANDSRSQKIGIIYVAPNDEHKSVLAAILTQNKLGRKHVAVVLPDVNIAFRRATDFDDLKDLRRKIQAQIIFVATMRSGLTEIARKRRFTVFLSLESYTKTLQEGTYDQLLKSNTRASNEISHTRKADSIQTFLFLFTSLSLVILIISFFLDLPFTPTIIIITAILSLLLIVFILSRPIFTHKWSQQPAILPPSATSMVTPVSQRKQPPHIPKGGMDIRPFSSASAYDYDESDILAPPPSSPETLMFTPIGQQKPQPADAVQTADSADGPVPTELPVRRARTFIRLDPKTLDQPAPSTQNRGKVAAEATHATSESNLDSGIAAQRIANETEQQTIQILPATSNTGFQPSTSQEKDKHKGIPDQTTIASTPEQPVPPNMNIPRIFVSHSSQDNEFGLKLVQDLRNAVGNEEAVWYDAAGGLYGGDPWWTKIKQELRARPIFIVILSPNALASPWVNDEINIAWRQKNSSAGKRIIPIHYQPCEIPDDLDTLQVVSFLDSHPNTSKYQSSFQALLKALNISPR